jgi:hypothetical protein
MMQFGPYRATLWADGFGYLVMSIQIHSEHVAGIATPLAAPVDGGSRPEAPPRAESIAGGGGDQVAISSLSGNIAASAAALASQHASRVSQLAALYGKGAYQPDSLQTSRALVSAAMAAGVGEEG